jgi:hypothetical protein
LLVQRILFAPAASLFFPYLISIYAGEIYVAEVRSKGDLGLSEGLECT